MGGAAPRWDVVPSPAPPVLEVRSGITARDVAAVFFRRRKIILGLFASIFTAAAVGVTLLGPWLNPPRYTSSLKLIVKKDRFDAVITPAERSVPGITTTVTPQEVLAEIELLKSSDVVERLSHETGAPGDRLRRGLAAEPVASGRNSTNWIVVRYTAADPGEVSRVLSRLPEIYLEKHLSVNRRPGVLEYFQSQLESGEREVHEAEEALAQFEKRQPPSSGEEAVKEMRLRLADLARLRAEADAALREGESRREELKRQLEATPATVRTSQPVEEPVQVTRLKSQIAELETRRAHTTFRREIERIDRRIAELRGLAEAELRQARDRAGPAAPNPERAGLERGLAEARVLEAGLKARRASLAAQERFIRDALAAASRAAAGAAKERSELLRWLKMAEENAQFYRRKFAEAREAELLDQKRVLNVAVAEKASDPIRVEKRPQWFYLAFAFLLAVVVSAATGFGVEALDRSIHTPRQLEACISLPVLACIPQSRQL